MHQRSYRRRVILVAGPDGAGKTTLASALEQRIRLQDLSVRHEHFLPRMAKSPNQDASGLSQPHSLKPRSLFLSVVAISYRYSVFIIASVVSQIRESRSALIIRERGWIDQAIDPKRYRLAPASLFVVRFFNFFIPRPWLVVLCGGDADEISRRKSEISREETERQLYRWMEWLHGSKWVFVNTTDPSTNLNSIVDGLVEEIIPKFSAPAGLGKVRLFARRHDAIASKRDGQLGLRATAPGYSLKATVAHGLALRVHQVSPVPTSTAIPFPIQKLLGPVRSDQVVSIIRSTSRQRWILALVSGRRVTSIAKVEHASAMGLVREAHFLERLSGKPLPFAIPEIIQVSASGPWASVILKYMGTSSRETDIYDGLELAIGLAQAGVTHGDLTPWNVLADQGLVVLDWEYSRVGLEPGFDLLRFALTSGHLNFEQLNQWMADREDLPLPFRSILESYETKIGVKVRESLVELPTELNLLMGLPWRR